MNLDAEAADSRGLLLRCDLFGAPVRVGAMVEIRDDVRDASVEEAFLGHRGVVTGLYYDDPRAQLPGSPLVVVRVAELGEELFFASELRAVRPAVDDFGAERQIQ